MWTRRTAGLLRRASNGLIRHIHTAGSQSRGWRIATSTPSTSTSIAALTANRRSLTATTTATAPKAAPAATATPSPAAAAATATTATATTSSTASASSSLSTAFGGGVSFGSSFNVLTAKRRFTTFGLNGAVEALHNGILENDDYYRKGIPASKFRLALDAGAQTAGAGAAAASVVFDATSNAVTSTAAAASALREKLHSILRAHRHVDPFAIVEKDLSQLTASIKSIIGSDHPVLLAVAKYFFEVNGKRIRPTILLLVARALNFGLDPTSAESSVLSSAPTAAASPLLSSSFKSRLYTPPLNPSITAASAQAATPSPHVPLTPFNSPNYPNSMSAPITVMPDGSIPTAASAAASAPVGAASASASAIGSVAPSQKTISEITEMIHTASLLHDDVVDDAKTRRGVSSLNAVFGNKVAILGGDFLLARASVSLARLRDPYVTELLSLVIEHLVKGEIMQAKPLVLRAGRLWENLEYYMTKTYYKTASLIAHSCKAVAVLGGHDTAVQEIAYEFGKSIGLAFQIVDDLLDYESSSLTLGKPAHNDLAQGIVTAPLLFAAEEFPELREMIQRKFERAGDIDRAIALVEKSGGIEKARELAHSCVADAVAAILQLKPSLSRSALIRLTDIVLHRDK